MYKNANKWETDHSQSNKPNLHYQGDNEGL